MDADAQVADYWKGEALYERLGETFVVSHELIVKSEEADPGGSYCTAREVHQRPAPVVKKKEGASGAAEEFNEREKLPDTMIDE